MSRKIFYVDTETTGIDPDVNDIVQLAFMIEVDGKIMETQNWHLQPFNYSTISPEAMKKQHRNVDQLRQFKKPEEVYDDLRIVLNKYIDPYDKRDKFYPAGYNVRFDADFLNSFFKKNGDKYYGSYFSWKFIDAYPLLHLLDSMGKIALPDYKLGTVCNHFGISLKAHDALEDIRATIQLINILKAKYIRD